jgi:hypothetical protein
VGNSIIITFLENKSIKQLLSAEISLNKKEPFKALF